MHLNSSNLESADYDGSGTLIIAFRNGTEYAYYGVPYSEYSGLIHASSHGQYHARHIKNRYRYRRIR